MGRGDCGGNQTGFRGIPHCQWRIEKPLQEHTYRAVQINGATGGAGNGQMDERDVRGAKGIQAGHRPTRPSPMVTPQSLSPLQPFGFSELAPPPMDVAPRPRRLPPQPIAKRRSADVQLDTGRWHCPPSWGCLHPLLPPHRGASREVHLLTNCHEATRSAQVFRSSQPVHPSDHW